MESLRLALGFEGMVVVEAQGHSGGLAMLWKHNEEVQLAYWNVWRTQQIFNGLNLAAPSPSSYFFLPPMGRYR